MADLDENIVTVLLADGAVSAITTTIAVNNVPDSRESDDYIWIRSSGKQQSELALGSNTYGDMYIETFDIECTSSNLDNAKDLQSAVGAALHGKNGSFGDQNVAFIDVIDQVDEYETKQDFGDSDNLHVAGLVIEIGVDGS
jgi:hypothetical protein